MKNAKEKANNTRIHLEYRNIVKQKGITLIALVITIIILLILARRIAKYGI